MKTIARPFVVAALSASVCLIGAPARAADVQSAIAEFNSLQHDKARQTFLELLKEDRHKNLANYYLGRIALGQGHYQEATEYFEAGVAIEPNSADELYWLSTSCSVRMQRPSEAQNMGLFFCFMQNLENALTLDPAHLQTLTGLHQLNATGPAVMGASPERAEELLVKIAAISKADADVAQLLVLNSKKETNKALALAQTMIVAYPNSERAMLEAGRVMSNNRRYVEAMTAFGKAIAKPVTIDNRQWIQAAHVEIGHVSWRTKDGIDRGIAALTKSVDANVFPVNLNTNWAYLRLAQLSQLKGDVAGQKKYLALLDKTGIEKGAFLLKEVEALGPAGGR